ncbi:MAG TPA: HAMP domain-containing sensor histidine kinase [Acidimicrobiales bacterium]|nr:HAMP domain-containing sensor histidine kinase [Acidimicrobiales bacterium]
MRLATRLSILLVVVTTAVAAVVGYYAVHTTSREAYASIDGEINAVVASGINHPLTALSSAVAAVQEYNFGVTLDVVGPTGEVTQIIAGAKPLRAEPSHGDVTRSLSGIRSSSDLPGFVYRTESIGGGEFLLVAASTASIAAAVHGLVVRTIVIGALAALVVGLAARLILERDLRTMRRLVGYARQVAGGDLTGASPVAVGSVDVRQLHSSLDHMVTSLKSTIDAEKRLSEVTQQFIGDASHELRTPLTVVRGYVELLGRPEVSDEQRARAVERMAREVARMEQLVSDLLFLAEVRELPVVEDERVELSDLVERAAYDFVHDNPQRSVEVRVEPDLVVAGRADYFERLLTNALTNVSRHTSSNDPARVSLARVGATVTLCVDDGGPGLPTGAYGSGPEHFQRFDPARSRSSGGAGLGMSIMSNVTGALGGSMTTSRSDLGGLSVSFAFAASSAR